MSQWVPVIAALLGTIIGGSMTLAVSIISTRMRFEEERAVWAVNRRLEQLHAFHAAVEQLFQATQRLRIRVAREKFAAEDEIEIPEWVGSRDQVREAFETAFRSADLSVSLMDDDLIHEFSLLREAYWDKFMLAKDPTEGLMSLEAQIEAFRGAVARRFRETVCNRIQGRNPISKMMVSRPEGGKHERRT